MTRPRSSRSNRSKRSRCLGWSREMSFFNQRQRDTAGAQQLVVKLTQNKSITQPHSFLVAQSVDDRPAQGIAHGARWGLAVPVEIGAGLRAWKVELAHHEIRRFVVGHFPGLGFDVDDYAKRAPKAILEHHEAMFFAF